MVETQERFDCVLLQAIRDEILRLLPDKRCYYHYNPSACIQGPILYFNWCTDYDHHWKSLHQHQIQILIHGGKIYITKDPQPAREPTNIIAWFDLAAPSFCVGDLTRALRKYYGPQDSGNPRRLVAAGRGGSR